MSNTTDTAPIFMVAPYSPIGSNANPNLGAAKKIAAIISALSALGRDVVLVNSAHNETRRSGLRREHMEISPGLTVEVITPPTYPSRPFGKALNLLQARSIARDLSERGASLLWIYNGYAFECRFALEFIERTHCPLVIELEDMPFARRRPGNIKPRLDDHYMRRVLPMAALVTCVNDFIPGALGLSPEKTLLLPGLVDSDLIAAGGGKPPFSRPDLVAGYFGNLSAEKGADLILQLSHKLPANWRLVVTGSGPLARDFIEAAKSAPAKIKFVPDASYSEVLSNMLSCDAIINPHTPISSMGNGVFPFKVIEAVATGRLVISTALPECGLDLGASVMFVGHDDAGLAIALTEAAQFYATRKSRIESVANEARARFSLRTLSGQVRDRSLRDAASPPPEPGVSTFAPR